METKTETPKTATKKAKPETAIPATKKKKTGGRQKGTRNKTTAQLKDWVFAFVSENLPNFKKDFKSLPSDEQFNIIVKLMPYVLPKQTETKISLDEELTKAVKDSMDKVNEMFK